MESYLSCPPPVTLSSSPTCWILLIGLVIVWERDGDRYLIVSRLINAVIFWIQIMLRTLRRGWLRRLICIGLSMRAVLRHKLIYLRPKRRCMNGGRSGSFFSVSPLLVERIDLCSRRSTTLSVHPNGLSFRPTTSLRSSIEISISSSQRISNYRDDTTLCGNHATCSRYSRCPESTSQ